MRKDFVQKDGAPPNSAAASGGANYQAASGAANSDTDEEANEKAILDS